MKRIKTIVAAALFFAAMFFVSSCSKETATVTPIGETARISTRAAGPSANGQGALFLDYPEFAPGMQYFSFHANTGADGSVTGSFETKWGSNGRLHGTIDCLSILPDGKTAIMSGTVTDVDGETYIDYGFAAGLDAWFKVQDNGEGAKSIEDSFTDIFVGYDYEPCTFDYGIFGVELLTIQNGNIQVKP